MYEAARTTEYLPKYQILFINGYGQDKHSHERRAIYNIEKTSYGIHYLCVNLDTFKFTKENVCMVTNIENIRGCTIGIYYKAGDMADPAEVEAAIIKAHKKQQQEKEMKEAEERKIKHLEAIGEKWFKDNMPADTKAVIIAEYHQNESDIMTDYFGSRTTKTVVLAFSKHTRDLFSEMRKAAAKSNNPGIQELAANNPALENREKYSMGAGYYLGHHRHSGWQVSKYNLRCGLSSLYLAKGKEISSQLPDDTGELEPTVILPEETSNIINFNR